MTRDISNSDDIIDSRDVIARIEELRQQQQDAIEDPERCASLDEDEAHELAALTSLADEAEGCGDWAHGETLIRESYFKEYAQDLAEDIGALDRNATWPMNCIDWDHAARELRMDYSSVEFDGVTYLLRS